jgi:hypothetical protein
MINLGTETNYLVYSLENIPIDYHHASWLMYETHQVKHLEEACPVILTANGDQPFTFQISLAFIYQKKYFD